MNEEQQKRVGFEVWYRGRYCRRLSDRAASIVLRTNPNGEYDSYHVREAWEIWQAALSAKSVPDAPFMDLEDSDYVAKRFRLILSKLGISTPESNEIGDPRFIDISFIPTIASMSGEQK